MLSNLGCVMYTHTHHTCTCTHTHTRHRHTTHTHTKYQLLGGVGWRREESTTCWREHSAAKGCRESKNLKPVWTWLFTTAHPNFLLSLSQEQLSVLDSFTGCPLPEDILLYSIPVWYKRTPSYWKSPEGTQLQHIPSHSVVKVIGSHRSAWILCYHIIPVNNTLWFPWSSLNSKVGPGFDLLSSDPVLMWVGSVNVTSIIHIVPVSTHYHS